MRAKMKDKFGNIIKKMVEDYLESTDIKEIVENRLSSYPELPK